MPSKAAIVISAELARREHQKTIEEITSMADRVAAELGPGFYTSEVHPGLVLEIFKRNPLRGEDRTGYLLHSTIKGEGT